MGRLDKDGCSSTNSPSFAGYMNRGGPYDAVASFVSEVLDFGGKGLGGVDFLDSDDFGPRGRDHVEVVFKRPSEVMADDVEGTGLRLNALELSLIHI